ncbi:hypothetical protein [Bordetella sp. 15P40C-2]|uniref:hypothetical protein n=1 Tax=Bordetella sp. 15P40C-2 TaxID=2572246 RepID=UPI0013223AD9|nr:hypothetical protein [Bordetella sp. 15P40C-2]MVW71945.1 hypothetical protein [Bordetella sp. 15P40C-2]
MSRTSAAHTVMDRTAFAMHGAIEPIPLHGLKRLYIGMAVAYYGLCDRLGR